MSLYLINCSSVYLGIKYATNHSTQKEMLLTLVVTHCLQDGGKKIGQLLESASEVGADLSRLVREIPTGVEIDGLKDKLLKAISDYRQFLNLNAETLAIAGSERLHLLQTCSHTVRRGTRVSAKANIAPVTISTESGFSENGTRNGAGAGGSSARPKAIKGGNADRSFGKRVLRAQKEVALLC